METFTMIVIEVTNEIILHIKDLQTTPSGQQVLT